MTPKHDSMRGWFAAALHEAMARDKSVWCLTGDLGWKMLNDVQHDYPDRFLNCGASETAMLGAAVGLALSGCKPFAYSITPFLIYRPFEWLRNYLNHEGVPVRLVGSGLDDDYQCDGFTHHAHDARELLALQFANIDTYFPCDKSFVPGIVNDMVQSNTPSFLCLRR